MMVVSDTSPITNLIKIGRINLLHNLYDTVVIPPAVHREATHLDEYRQALSQLDWIRAVTLGDDTDIRTFPDTLDAGEAEAIALAIELKADILLIDETDGRRVAVEHGLTIIGFLTEAKAAGLIPLIKPELDNLATKARFWMSPQLVAQALEAADET